MERIECPQGRCQQTDPASCQPIMMFFHGDYPEKPTLHMGSEFCQDSLTIRAAQFVQAHLFCHGGSEFHLG